ncbi:hypothetical protein [Arthrobacter silvisoli]|uniref:hypothetical protein n=1 Tax=Arthrobacter silvisoli TaxID=2291022 RepID=UPI000E20E66B|nr:hypothetical protein [Arthrobacter silvisoli]
MTAGHPVPGYRDTRDLTPFRRARVRTHATGLADGVGGAVSGVLRRRNADRLSVAGAVPPLKPFAGRTAKAVHAAAFSGTEPERLLLLARSNPGWAGLCQVLAGLLAYKQGGYLRAAEILRLGISTRIDYAASQFSAAYLGRVVSTIEVTERVEVEVLFSEESVFLALSHCLREAGQPVAALAALAGLPPSLPAALARCTAASALGRHRDVADWTEGLLNADELSAALLLLRSRSLRALGDRAGAQAALSEVLRRRKTSRALRNDALTDRALLAVDAGRRALLPWSRRPPAGLEDGVILKDAEMRRLWERDWKDLGGE